MNRTTIIADFLRLRREIRTLQTSIQRGGYAVRFARRTAKKLDAGSALDVIRAAHLRKQIYGMETLVRGELEHRMALGQRLFDIAPAFDAATTLRQRCDLLNINEADRAKLAADDGLILLVAGYSLEDSAAHRGEEFHDGPLFNSIQLLIINALNGTPAGREAVDLLLSDVFGANPPGPPPVDTPSEFIPRDAAVSRTIH